MSFHSFNLFFSGRGKSNIPVPSVPSLSVTKDSWAYESGGQSFQGRFDFHNAFFMST